MWRGYTLLSAPQSLRLQRSSYSSPGYATALWHVVTFKSSFCTAWHSIPWRPYCSQWRQKNTCRPHFYQTGPIRFESAPVFQHNTVHSEHTQKTRTRNSAIPCGGFDSPIHIICTSKRRHHNKHRYKIKYYETYTRHSHCEPEKCPTLL